MKNWTEKQQELLLLEELKKALELKKDKEQLKIVNEKIEKLKKILGTLILS